MANILIVDDDYLSIEQVQILLESLGHETVYTLHPKHIFNILSEEHVDLILLDINMPEVMGTELLKQLKSSHKYSDIPVIMLTADQNEDLLYECFCNGAVDYVNKPYRKVILGARVESALKTRNTIEQLKRFVGIVSHDLRNPIGVIMGYSELIPKNDENKKMIEQIEIASRRCRDLVNDLLDMMAMQTGKIKIHKGCYKLNEILSMAAETAIPRLEKKNIHLDTECGDYSVFVDKNRIIQVLDNLLSNAIKFSQRGSLISIEAQDRGDVIRVSVTDQGTGIPEDKISELFHKHKKTTTKGTEGEKGTGFGLPLAQELIKAHGSEIVIESIIGEGSSFYFDLPNCTCSNCSDS
jgi:signal transduction histidine kinase